MLDFTKSNYDVIVVGSGPGGATTAKELAKKGKKVLILEKGPNPKLKNSIWQFIKYLMVPFRSMLITKDLLGMVRGIITGGSTPFYYATCFKIPHDMLKKYNIDVTKEEKEARNELPIAPLKDEMMTPMAIKIMEAAQSLGYKWQKLEKFMYQDKWTPGTPFGYYGDPNDIKWTARMYIDEAVELGAVLINGATVQRVLSDNGSATAVQCKIKGKKYIIKAKKIVIAAGGIGSPVILRKSGIKEAGYNYFFDPLVSVCGVVDDLRAHNEIPMSCGVHMESDGYMMTDMSLPPMVDATFTAQVFRFHRVFSQKKTLRIMIKAKDTLGGSLSNGGQVRKRLSKEDKDKLNHGADRARKILEAAGAKGIFRTWYLAAHPGGTVKIGELIDSNLKSVDLQNLYVCDCSVIPEAWGLPPTLTIIALAKRLAKHLANEKNTGVNAKTKKLPGASEKKKKTADKNISSKKTVVKSKVKSKAKSKAKPKAQPKVKTKVKAKGKKKTKG